MVGWNVSVYVSKNEALGRVTQPTARSLVELYSRYVDVEFDVPPRQDERDVGKHNHGPVSRKEYVVDQMSCVLTPGSGIVGRGRGSASVRTIDRSMVMVDG